MKGKEQHEVECSRGWIKWEDAKDDYGNWNGTASYPPTPPAELMSWHVLCSGGKEMGIWGALKILCMTIFLSIFLYSWNNFHIIPGLVSGVHTLATVLYRFWLSGDLLGVGKSKNMLVVRNKSSGFSGKLTVLVIHLWWALTTSYHWYYFTYR